MRQSSIQFELHLDSYSHRTRLPILRRGLEPPSRDGFYCLLVETRGEALDNLDVRRLAIFGHNDRERNHALNLFLPSFLVVVGSWLIDRARMNSPAVSAQRLSIVGFLRRIVLGEQRGGVNDSYDDGKRKNKVELSFLHDCLLHCNRSSLENLRGLYIAS